MTTPASSWWLLSTEQAAAELASDLARGLPAAEAAGRLSSQGPNRLQEKKAVSPWSIFFDQFKDFMIWVLTGAALVSGFLQEWVDALAIVAIVIVNAVLGFLQEYRAEKSLEALRQLSTQSAKVIRGGEPAVVNTEELVRGDLIELEAGDRVPADARLVWLTANFTVDEASLTGESNPVGKKTAVLPEKSLPLADRANLVFSGTSVASGRGRAIVTATGMETELGKIAGMIQEIGREQTPLQKKLEEFGKWIVYLCFALVGMVFLVSWLRGGKLLDMFLTSVSLAVAAIPEGLPAVVTIALALGVQRMVKRHALIRKLPSVETLGCATVICSDKTGTLTRNEMTVRAVLAGGRTFEVGGAGYAPSGDFTLAGKRAEPARESALIDALTASVLCNGARLAKEEETWRIFGDPTEGALLTAAAKAGLWKHDLEKTNAFRGEIPFDSERKMMTVVREKAGGGVVAFTKGAPDVLLSRCSSQLTPDGILPLSAEKRAEILAVNDRLAERALRVLAVARRSFDRPPADYDSASVENNLTFLGLLAMIDPPREEVKAAIAECRSAGIHTVMITGDHKKTAAAIARELGFFPEGSRAITGEELDGIVEDKFREEVASIPVYARVSPEHKLRIVRAWRKRGDVVAMTGDGVNDAPAIKEADIGVAMGITGTDVTKEVSDMVVTDDNFASIVAAVEEGRGIYANIRKFIHYLLSCNAGEILTMFVSSLMGFPVPLLPIQILWVNLVTDGLPALALGMDPVDKRVMLEPPRDPQEPVITGRRARQILLQGAFIALCSLLAFGFVYFVEEGIRSPEKLARARTAAFVVLSTAQLFHALNCRSQSLSLFRLGVFTNAKLIAADLISFLLLLIVIYLPFLQRVFKTVPLSLSEWLLVVAVSSFPFWAMEAVKAIGRRRKA
jgi:Ca2+-transporting ATPase